MITRNLDSDFFSFMFSLDYFSGLFHTLFIMVSTNGTCLKAPLGDNRAGLEKLCGGEIEFWALRSI